ncbi:MAG: chromosome segregation protein SMC, partial [Oscillospiraceae bacterium]|nr:chromosome segregation protein SMC [Oscillospiraceae bacterium]
MYLKRIELQGFKSFADKTVIDAHSGITAIVGPNGSGKSNISDAVRWVMGEQSAKALRGGKMEDVIFNGTQKRKALGYAEVSMVFDNSSGFLPSEYAEVEITRRVFRSGESEYMINRAPCRLRDIHEMFMDTGMGRDGYSIVGQGKIAEIVSQKGEERRSVFEEAAGISKYRYRKEEAERKLAHTEDNLTRVRDILAELETRVGPLEKQSEKAVKYLNLREELKGIEVSALLDVIDARKRQLSEIEGTYAAAAEQFEAAKKRKEGAEKENEELFQKAREADEELETVRARLSEAEAESAALAGEIALNENNINNAKENLIRLRLEIENHDKTTDGVRTEIQENEAATGAAKERLGALNEELAALEALLREATREMAAKNNELEEAKSSADLISRQKAEASTKIEGIDALEESFARREEALKAELSAAEAELKGYGEEIEKLENEEKCGLKNKEKAEKSLSEKNEAISALERRIQDKKDESNALVSRSGEKNARLNMLKDMERHLEGYARSVRELVGDHRSGKYHGRLIGVLSKLIKTDNKYITAVEIALGGAMQNIVVETEADAKEAIEYLKRNKLGRITFLPVSTQQGRRLEDEKRILASPGAVAVASDLVECDQRLSGVLTSLLGRTLVVDTIDNANRIARENKYRFRIVTLSGELLQPGGSITGGSINQSQALLRRGEEIAALEKECAALEKQSEKVENEIDELYDELDGIRERAEEARELAIKAESELQRTIAEADMKRSLNRMAMERIAKLSDEQAELRRRRSEADESKNELSGFLSGSDSLIAGAEKEIEDRRKALAEATEKREAASEKAMNKRMEISSAEKDIEVLKARAAELRERLSGSGGEKEEKLREKGALEERIKLLTSDIEKNRAEAGEMAKAIAAVREDIDRRVEEKSGTNTRLEDIRKLIKELSDEVFAMQEEVVRLETRKSKMEGECESAAARLWDDYELTYNTALPYRKDVGSVTAAQKRVSELKGKIRALGDVNVGAIEEYKEVKERYEFMNNQVNDLEEGKRNLEKLIDEMLVVMRGQFAERFKVINENFSKIFVDLFGGGHAAVTLSDPKDVLESSIEIEVQPPGKKLQSISLLSGG